jgi:hypothetical protein
MMQSTCVTAKSQTWEASSPSFRPGFFDVVGRVMKRATQNICKRRENVRGEERIREHRIVRGIEKRERGSRQRA